MGNPSKQEIRTVLDAAVDAAVLECGIDALSINIADACVSHASRIADEKGIVWDEADDVDTDQLAYDEIFERDIGRPD